MSHITRIKSKMIEREFVLAALDDLGFRYAVGELAIGGVVEPRQKVEIRVKAGWIASIGLRKTGAFYESVAGSDFVSRERLKRFTEQVTQRYVYHTVRDKLERQGFDLVEEDEEQNGRINLVLRRAAG